MSVNAVTYQGKDTNINEESFFFLQDLLQFLFPSHLQHPLSRARLILYGMYGPLRQKEPNR